MKKKAKKKKGPSFEEEFEYVVSLLKKWGFIVGIPDNDEDKLMGMIAGTKEYLYDTLELKEPVKHWRSDDENDPFPHFPC